jgi:hypothetical protein
MTDTMAPVTRWEGPSPAIEIARDLARRALLVAPIGLLIGAMIDGIAGAASVGYGLLIVVVNFLLSAAMLGRAARISFAAVGAAALLGYGIRLGLIFVAVMAVRDQSWVSLVPLGITLIATHLGLLFWELRFVSGSLAYPGLKPTTHRSKQPSSTRSSTR